MVPADVHIILWYVYSGTYQPWRRLSPGTNQHSPVNQTTRKTVELWLMKAASQRPCSDFILCIPAEERATTVTVAVSVSVAAVPVVRASQSALLQWKWGGRRQ
jgi:hypothetical protein